MLLKKTLLVVVLGVAMFAMPGCMGGGGSDSASKGRFSFRSKNKNSAKPKKKSSKDGELGNLTPEASLKRDLALLEEQEKTQAKRVTDMRGDLAMGKTMVDKEEQKLAELRTQVSRYRDTMGGYGGEPAQNRQPRQDAGGYEMASRQGAGGGGPQSPYGRRAQMAPGEEMVYNGAGQPDIYAMAPSRGYENDNSQRNGYGNNQDGGYQQPPSPYYSAPAPVRQQAPGDVIDERYAEMGEYQPTSPYMGAAPMARRQQQQRPQQPQAYARQSPPPQMQVPVPPQQRQQPPRMQQPQTRQQAPQQVQQQQQARKPQANIASPQPQGLRPTAQAKRSGENVAKQPVSYGDDEVFSPDMYLSGGR